MLRILPVVARYCESDVVNCFESGGSMSCFAGLLQPRNWIGARARSETSLRMIGTGLHNKIAKRT